MLLSWKMSPRAFIGINATLPLNMAASMWSHFIQRLAMFRLVNKNQIPCIQLFVQNDVACFPNPCRLSFGNSNQVTHPRAVNVFVQCGIKNLKVLPECISCYRFQNIIYKPQVRLSNPQMQMQQPNSWKSSRWAKSIRKRYYQELTKEKDCTLCL